MATDDDSKTTQLFCAAYSAIVSASAVATAQPAETDREYVDRLKRSYYCAKEFEARTGLFMWANIVNPTPEESERHHLLVKQAETELGTRDQK